jgi:hypothetical protein
VPDQKKNAGNEGDVMKHAPLQEVVRQLKAKDKTFWYVETHAGHPYYFLPEKGDWKSGIGHLDKLLTTGSPPQPLKDYHQVAYQDKQCVHASFPDKRTFLGSAAQVFQLLRDDKRRIRMTLFEKEAEPAGQLFQYFKEQGARAVLVGISDDAAWFDPLPKWWDDADAAANDDDLVMIVQGDSYKLAPSLWENRSEKPKPDLVLVDPYKLQDSKGQPKGILDSLSNSKVPFMCWTPLNGKTTKKWSRPADWSFLQGGVTAAYDFVEYCRQKPLTCAWFS